jgi:hypothetical protein
VVFFALASVVSVFVIAQKVLMFAERVRSRHLIAAATPAVASLDGVAVSPDVGQLESVRELKDRFDENRSETKQLYLVLLLGLCEGSSVFARVSARPTANQSCGRSADGHAGLDLSAELHLRMRRVGCKQQAAEARDGRL